jgi:hypothetical protein
MYKEAVEDVSDNICSQLSKLITNGVVSKNAMAVLPYSAYTILLNVFQDVFSDSYVRSIDWEDSSVKGDLLEHALGL